MNTGLIGYGCMAIIVFILTMGYGIARTPQHGLGVLAVAVIAGLFWPIAIATALFLDENAKP